MQHRIELETSENLEVDLSKGDAILVITHLSSNKSLGLDGLAYWFFKKIHARTEDQTYDKVSKRLDVKPHRGR